MKQNDYVKYLTEQLVSHMNTSKQERKKLKEKKSNTLIYSNQWFGLFPFTIKLLFKK